MVVLRPVFNVLQLVAYSRRVQRALVEDDPMHQYRDVGGLRRNTALGVVNTLI